MLVALGFVCAIIVAQLDRVGAKELGASEAIATQSKRVVRYYTVHGYIIHIDMNI